MTPSDIHDMSKYKHPLTPVREEPNQLIRSKTQHQLHHLSCDNLLFRQNKYNSEAHNQLSGYDKNLHAMITRLEAEKVNQPRQPKICHKIFLLTFSYNRTKTENFFPKKKGFKLIFEITNNYHKKN